MDLNQQTVEGSWQVGFKTETAAANLMLRESIQDWIQQQADSRCQECRIGQCQTHRKNCSVFPANGDSYSIGLVLIAQHDSSIFGRLICVSFITCHCRDGGHVPIDCARFEEFLSWPLLISQIEGWRRQTQCFTACSRFFG